MTAIIINTIGVFVDPVIALILLYILIFDRKVFAGMIGLQLACALAVSGLIGQTLWSWNLLTNQRIPNIETMPWWIGKDLGYFVFACTYFYYQRFRKPAKTASRT